MSGQVEQSTHSTSSSTLESYIAYPFDSDETYQQGLESLIAGGAIAGNLTLEEEEEAIRRTRVFYFNRITGNALSVEEVRAHDISRKQTQCSEEEDRRSEDEARTGAANDEARILTFAELQELIESGKTDQIPNNKVIPERLNEAPPSQSKAPLRKKPWEVPAES